MSKNNVENFYIKVKQDIELKEKLEQIKKNLERSKKEVSLENLKQKIITLAHEHHFDFTSEELDEYLEKIKSQLTEEELLKISAGISKKLAVLGLSGALLTSLGTGIAMNVCISKVEEFQEQKNEHRKKVMEIRNKDLENRKQSMKNKKNQAKKKSQLIFKASAK